MVACENYRVGSFSTIPLQCLALPKKKRSGELCQLICDATVVCSVERTKNTPQSSFITINKCFDYPLVTIQSSTNQSIKHCTN